MSKESVETQIYRAVEEAIENNISVKEFIQMASISWQERLSELDIHAQNDFMKLLNVKDVH